MKTIRTFLTAWIAALVTLLVLASGASAYSNISSSPIDVWSNGKGQFTAQHSNANSAPSQFFYDSSNSYTAGAGDAGLNIGIYGFNGGGTSKVFGFRGTAFTNTSTPSGTTTAPYNLSSKYTTGNCASVTTCLEVTESDQYTAGAHSFLITYDVKNVSAVPIRFRATSGGDVMPGDDEGGAGRYVSSGTPYVGTLNLDRGAGMDIQQAGGPAWNHYMEDVPFSIWAHVQNPDGAGLPDTVAADGPDKAVAVEWDDHATAGNELAPGTSAHYELRWVFRDFNSMQVSPWQDAPTHSVTAPTVTVSANDESGPVSFASSPLYWRTTSGAANPQLGSSLGTWNKVATGTGSTNISYSGNNPGSDYLEFWIDSNNDGVQQPNEPYRTTSIYWYDRVDLSYADDSYPYTGSQDFVHLATRDGNDNYEARQFRYWVVDKATGTTRVPLSPTAPATYTTNALDGDYYDGAFPSDSGIPLTRDTPGTDVVHVVTDLGNNGTYGDQPGEEATFEVNWQPQLDLSSEGWVYTNSTGYLDAYGYESDGSETTHGIGWWATDPDAADPDASLHDEAPVAPDFGYTDWTLSPGDVGLNPSSAGRRIYHVYIDEDDSGTYDPGEPVVTREIDWLLSPTHRMSFGNYSSNATVGYSKHLTATVLKPNGDPQSGVHVFYEVTGVHTIPVTDGGTTDASGHLTITIPSGSAGNDYVSAWPDFISNGAQDTNEPSDSVGLLWGAPIRISTYDVHVPSTAYASVGYYDQNGDPVNQALLSSCTYSIGPTHPVATTACPIGSTITWPGTATSVTGPDTVTVNANIPGIGASSAQATVNFLDQVGTYPALPQTKTVGQQLTLTPQIYNATSSGRTFHYVITGANPQSGDVTYGNSIEYTGTNPGDDTITISTTSPTAQTVGTVHWNPDTLTITGTGDVTQGAIKNVTATYRDAVTGNPVQGTVLRWTVGGPDALYGKNAAQTDANGQVPISWPTHETGLSYPSTDYLTVYADLNNNGSYDSGEPRKQSIQITTHPPLEPDDDYYSARQGNQRTITVTYRDLNFQPIQGKQLKYEVVDDGPFSPAGNPVPPAAMPAVTDSNGRASITLTGTNAGDDLLKIWDDTDNDNVIDPGEEVSATELYWTSRVSMSPFGTASRQVTSGPLTVTGSLFRLDGTLQANASVTYSIVGLHDSGGAQTVTTDSNGAFSLPAIPADNGGQDVVTVWLDLDNDGVLDSGESRQVLTINWTGAVTVTPSSQTLYQNGTHSAITVTGSGISPTTGSLAVSYSGPNVSGRATTRVLSNWGGASYPVPAITGGTPGTDYVHAWWDKDNDGVQDSGEPGSTAWVTWKPLISLGNATGTLQAGDPTTFTATLVDTSGNPVTGASNLKFKVAGTNARTAAAVPGSTDGSGQIPVTYTSSDAGTDTVTVWRDLDGDGVVDAGEPQGTKTIYWAAPPVVLTASPLDGHLFQTKSSAITVTLTGMPGGNNARTIRWSVTGANPTSGTATTDGAGQAVISWAGTNDGTDTLLAYADVAGASGALDSFDPRVQTTVIWDPLVRITGGVTEETTGATHTENIQFVDNSGNPLANAQIIYAISGANPTSGNVIARAASGGTGSQIAARTNGSGTATISWVGTNPGIDTLDVWADTAPENGLVDPGDPHAQKKVTFAGAAAAGSGGGPGSTPIGGSSVVTPGSANDFDGLPTPPPPVAAKSVNVAPVSGHVYVRLPGKSKFIELLDGEQIPVGSIVDVRKGTVALTSAQDLKGGVATAQFYAGEFQIAQKKAAKPTTDLLLYGGNFKPCASISKKGKRSSASQKKKIRELWGSGHGNFRTKGKYAAAAVRGTKWDVVDYCDGTLVKVAQGVIQVEPIKGKSRIVKAPKSLFVPVAGLAKKK